MSFKTILKISPQLETSELQKMENNLHSRFGRVASRFSSGLKKALTGGAILGAIDKLLNPLKEASEHLDSVFERAKSITDQAAEFGTTTGTLLKLQNIGQQSGVNPEEMSQLLVKFNAALIQARANPGQTSAVSNFVGEKDTADAFFKFLQGLKATGAENRGLALEEVFGNRKELGVSKLLGGDLNAKRQAAGAIDTGAASAAIANAVEKGQIETSQKALINDKGFITQAGGVSNEVIKARIEAEQLKVDRESYQQAHLEGLQNIDKTVNLVLDGMNRLLVLAGNLIGKFEPLLKSVDFISHSPLLRNVSKKLGIGN